jgi:two-component system cell cycle sensor histidine kinase/response regulator CckA
VGTEFKIYLPATESEIPEESKPSHKKLRGSGTILIVDDEEMIIDVAKRMLEKLGYEVMTADGGDAALEIYRKHWKKIDIVILDMIMPDENGGEVFDRLKQMNPNVKAVLSSGYSIDGMAAEIMTRGCKGFIQKPFGLKELSIKLKEVADAGKA